jgi:medium-chain acyl-[acyl-carrier-protein] hydrolase
LIGTTDTSGNLWVKPARPNAQARARLFCFPYAGGGASVYYKWAELLPPQSELCPAQLPGREMRIGEQPYQRLDPLVEATASALLPFLSRPFAFFGHSMGALLSFELARYLRRNYGISPIHLFVSGLGAPQLPRLRPPIHEAPDSEFLSEIVRLNGTPKEVLEHSELLGLMLPLLRADFAVCETYEFSAEEPLSCPISAYGGLEDEDSVRDRLEPWREHTSGAFTLRMFPGDHFFLNSARALLLRAVAVALEETLASTVD